MADAFSLTLQPDRTMLTPPPLHNKLHKAKQIRTAGITLPLFAGFCRFQDVGHLQHMDILVT
jgi:hypothetical protein